LRLAAVRRGEIHLLLSDVVMRGTNGRDLALRLAASRPRMKCLFMSGYTANVIAHRGILDQDLQFLAKPFNRNSLAHKLREVLES
jgi:YesN/AraC family two-component response regulator